MIDLPSKSEIKIRIKDILYANILEIAESKNLLADEVIEILIEYGVNLMKHDDSNTKEYKNVTLAVVDVLPEKKEGPKAAPLIVSFCCRAELITVSGDEGEPYQYYSKCTKCGKPADQYLPGFLKEKSSSRIMSENKENDTKLELPEGIDIKGKKESSRTFVSPSIEEETDIELDRSKPFTGPQENENGALEKEIDSELRSTFANGSNGHQIKKWCRKYDKCLKCSRADRKHAGKGFCYVCYATLYEKQQREKVFPPKDTSINPFSFDNLKKNEALSEDPKEQKKESTASEYKRPIFTADKKYCAYLHCPNKRVRRDITTMIKGENGGYYCSAYCQSKNKLSE